MLWKPDMRRIRLEQPEGFNIAPSPAAFQSTAFFNGPQTSASSSQQASTNQQVGVQGGTGIGAGSTTTGPVGNTGITTTGSGNHISISSSDPDVVEAAIASNTAIAGQSIVSSQATTGAALQDLEFEEEQAGATAQTAVAGGLNAATSALQYRAGQPVDQAVSANPFANLSTSTILAGLGLLLTVVWILTHRK